MRSGINAQLLATLHLSIAEAAGICGCSADHVSAWRRKQARYARATVPKRYSLSVGDRVIRTADYGADDPESGVIREFDGKMCLVEWPTASEWRHEHSLAYHPSPETVAERAAAIRAGWTDSQREYQQADEGVLPHFWDGVAVLD